ncbi:uncharacterized protein FOKN1_1322 [Thiohalobacter thiocyanaticus]|uniref:WYL domain-containing protein n=1 Tax=Thiohalobacter thiocyanaticus TaxID=585455 RepID=A0A1Z4VQ07_9GAMM|nr:hypothetical protein [Thiohalobacter thiocyanaticus]BAZ93720.1 uncharacterized protein FOKN1_1322 [Thiohalobacter thiocyanaticus]
MMEDRILFILRRTYWVGNTRRQDLVDAFNLKNPQRASEAIDKALKLYDKYLERWGARGGVTWRDGVLPPPEAAPGKIFALLQQGAPFHETGIRTNTELPVRLQYREAYRPDDESLEMIMRGILEQKLTRVLYVGLRRREVARWRWIVPRSLEFTGRQWRLLGFDLSDDTETLKSYVLSRIQDIQYDTPPRGQSGRVQQLHERPLDYKGGVYKVDLNDNLTPDQRIAIKQELGITGTNLQISDRDVYEFMRLYGDAEPSSEIVWPPVTGIRKLETRKD